jgi:hypothetical protein
MQHWLKVASASAALVIPATSIPCLLPYQYVAVAAAGHRACAGQVGRALPSACRVEEARIVGASDAHRMRGPAHCAAAGTTRTRMACGTCQSDVVRRLFKLCQTAMACIGAFGTLPLRSWRTAEHGMQAKPDFPASQQLLQLYALHSHKRLPPAAQGAHPQCMAHAPDAAPLS